MVKDKYNDNIQVSVYCLAYNHEAYIRNALEGFIKQKTNFKYEVLVHDDASTDNTAQIILEYAQKYPDIIKPIIQTTNQHSKNVAIFHTIILPRMNGKYIAVCEGDDYWCAEDKLQKQYDVMVSNPQCSMVVHNTIWHDITGQTPDTYFFEEKNIRNLTPEEVFLEWKVHTSSYFARKEVYETKNKYWCGDYVRLCIAFYLGEIICLPEIMSVYNANIQTGMTVQYYCNNEKINKSENARSEFLKEYDTYTNYKYHKYVNARILKNDLDFLDRQRIEALHKSDKKKYYEICKRIKKHPYFKEKVGKMHLMHRLLYKSILYFCHAYYVWFKIKEKIKRENINY